MIVYTDSQRGVLPPLPRQGEFAMTALFLKFLNLSITAGWLVLAVLAVRPFLKQSPRWIHCLLWGLVALRLGIPMKAESPFSLIPSPELIPGDIAQSQAPAIQSGIPIVNSAVNPLFIRTGVPQLTQQLLDVAAVIWLVGMGIMALLGLISWLRLRLQTRVRVRCRDRIWFCDDISTAFVLGIFRPIICIPSGVDPRYLEHIIAHEQTHLQRRDHWWKPLGFCLLTVYWFNPLLWLAYSLLCRDIEQACDEAVVSAMDLEEKKRYSMALLDSSTHRRWVTVCPVAFGEVSVKRRILGVLRYRRPSFWILAASVLVCALFALCFLTDPRECVHTYESAATQAATCTQAGVETLTCTQCQHSYTLAIEKKAHAFGEGTEAIPSTCVSQGLQISICSGCGAEKKEPLPLAEHVLSYVINRVEPDCTHTGQRTAECIVCQETLLLEILPTNDHHDLVERVLTEASCTAPGEGIWECTRCDWHQNCTYEQLAHDYQEKSRTLACCLWEGSREMVCSGCGKTQWIPIPKTDDHDYAPGFNGQRICRLCGAIQPGSGSGNYSLISPYTGNNPYGNPLNFPAIQIFPG